MDGWVAKIEKFNEKLNAFCAIGAEMLMVFIVILLVAEIALRFVFNHSIPGKTEFATLSLVVVVYFGLSYAQIRNAHIRVDVFISRVTGPTREFIEAWILSIALFTTVIMLITSVSRAIETIISKNYITGVINFPLWPGRCAVAFGFVLLTLTIVIQIVRRIISGLNGLKRCGKAEHG